MGQKWEPWNHWARCCNFLQRPVEEQQQQQQEQEAQLQMEQVS